MAYWWQLVRRTLNKSKTSTMRTLDGRPEIRSDKFIPLPLSTQGEVNDIIENEQLVHIKKFHGGQVERVVDCAARSAKLTPAILNVFNGSKSLLSRVADNIGYRDFMATSGTNGGLQNNMWMSGVNGQDPAMANHMRPNLYISPGDAATIYGNKGLPEIILNKKSKSMILNGAAIENPYYTQEQLEKINLGMIKSGLAYAASDGIRDGLTYGGSALFPMFKGDSPLSMTLNIPTLIRYGIVGKGCLERFVTLDRWNTVHFPQWNPTAADFRKPKFFYIPFLGCDVNSSRIARIVPSPQPGYWGVMMYMGWGPSDITGWIESVFNYMNVMQSIPTMIQQMSLIARTFNVEGPMATEGALVMDMVSQNETIRVRETSPNNPINLDVIGELKAIQRDFAEVPELMRLVRQDLAAKAGLLEDSLFTVERSAMGGGDQTATWTRQEETNRFMYTDVQQQLKPLAMLQVINELGLDRDVLKYLQYTTISFDTQKITDVQDRIQVTAAATKGFFDAVAGGMALEDALDLVQETSGNVFEISNDLRERLRERQARMDDQADEKHEAEVGLIDAQTTAAKTSATVAAAGGAPGVSSASKGPKKPGEKEGHSYSSRLEQKSHEKVKRGGGQKQGLARAAGKKVGS